MLETLPTLDTEVEDYKYGYMFLVAYNQDGLYVDSCFDVSAAVGRTWVGIMAAEKLTGTKDDVSARIALGVAGLQLRARFVHSPRPGPYLIKTESPLTRDQLENVLKAMSKERLKEVLKQAEM